MTGTCLGLVAALFEPLAPAIALAALTKMPCRWHCERQRQDGDIHRLAAGNALHSLVSSLPTGFTCPIVSSRTVIEFFVSRLPKLFARLRSIEPRAPFPTLTRCLPHPPFLPGEGDHGLGPPLMAGFFFAWAFGRP